MYTRKQTNINRHKSWHTQTFGHVKKVHEAETKEELKQKQIRERVAEREKELEKRYYEDLAAHAGVQRRRERVDFMYEFSGARDKSSGVELVSAEALQRGESTALPTVPTPGAAQADRPLAVDVESKVREDPLLRMKQVELSLLQEKLSNPMFEMALRKRQEADRRREDAREKRRAEKEAKKQRKAEKKQRKKERKKERKRRKKEKKKRKRRRSSSDSSSSDSDSDSSSSADAKSPTPKKVPSGGAAPAAVPAQATATAPKRRRVDITDEEREERRKVMESTARDWDRARVATLAQAAKRDAEEEREAAQSQQSHEYLRKQRLDMLASQTMAQRVSAGKYFATKDPSFRE
eukprot:TRINITY_DN5510_c1_g2_i1.p1 TRINITY_DN5510_c1_g2~~TRINITY_DN5510_c1_g2_i1.p1  ORF type:complete len:350 (+),score=115.25 TRINITY_DN5510_c1_g2_i1:78-1127(+)